MVKVIGPCTTFSGARRSLDRGINPTHFERIIDFYLSKIDCNHFQTSMTLD